MGDATATVINCSRNRALSQGTVKAHVSTILPLLGLYRRTRICR